MQTTREPHNNTKAAALPMIFCTHRVKVFNHGSSGYFWVLHLLGSLLNAGRCHKLLCRDGTIRVAIHLVKVSSLLDAFQLAVRANRALREGSELFSAETAIGIRIERLKQFPMLSRSQSAQDGEKQEGAHGR